MATVAKFTVSDPNVFTGDEKLDKFLVAALRRVGQVYQVSPLFGFSDQAETAAVPYRNAEQPGIFGMVTFNRDMFKEELYNRDETGLTVLAIAAHEFAHVLQFQRGICNIVNNEVISVFQREFEEDKTVRRIELHADLIAGYFIGLRKKAIPTLPVYSAGEVFHRFGDSNFTDQTHHGTSAERAAASQFGFDRGKNDNMSIDTIVDLGLAYVRSLKIKDI